MAKPPTGELLDFQDYSPEHERSARIDVEAVHTNQYNSSMSNQNFGYEEPKPEHAEQDAPKSNHNFWTVKYYQKYFDVQTNEVVERITSSIFPQKFSRTFFDEQIKGKPDLYGPIWIAATLIFTIAVSGNIASYLQHTRQPYWRYDFHLLSYAATAILAYVWLVPMVLWAAIRWTTPNTNLVEEHNLPTMVSLLCLYGYSLSIYIPVAILWTIQVSWLQWVLVVMAALDSGMALVFWLLPALKRSTYSFILIGTILSVHFLLAAGFMLCFFHVPEYTPLPQDPVNITTVAP